MPSPRKTAMNITDQSLCLCGLYVLEEGEIVTKYTGTFMWYVTWYGVKCYRKNLNKTGWWIWRRDRGGKAVNPWSIQTN